jgi:type VI secretion system protein ImpA
MFDIELISFPFRDKDGNESGGKNLRYEPIYDQIRENRAEEDATLSRGIWERELKKADWQEVQNLCKFALEKETKDLQIVAWLCESTCHLANWEGLLNSMKLMHNFCVNCWNICYPLDREDPTVEFEYRIRILDWFFRTMLECSLFMPITVGQGIVEQELTLSSWIEALNLDSVVKRSGGGEAQLHEMETGGRITLRRFRTIIRQANVSELSTVSDFTEKAIEETNKLYKFLQEKCDGQEPNFTKLCDQLLDVKKLCEFALEGRTNAKEELINKTEEAERAVSTELIYQEENVGTVGEIVENLEIPPQINAVNEINSTEEVSVITTREEAYNSVNDLADFLIEKDPQSICPYLIKIATSWSNKSFPEVLEDVKNGTSHGHKVLKMLSDFLKGV